MSTNEFDELIELLSSGDIELGVDIIRSANLNSTCIKLLYRSLGVNRRDMFMIHVKDLVNIKHCDAVYHNFSMQSIYEDMMSFHNDKNTKELYLHCLHKIFQNFILNSGLSKIVKSIQLEI